MSKVSFIITDSNVTVNYDGETHIINRDDTLADRLIKALKDGKQEDIPALVSAAKRIEAFSDGNFTVKDGVVAVNGVEAPTVLSNKIIKFSNEGLPYMPLVKFVERLQSNPSFRAVNELYGFLEKNDHPITEDGHFLAFKRVRGDFKDIHSGTFDNSPGEIVEMPRNQVNEDCNQTCSVGLHLANWEYAHTQYGNTSPDTTDIMVECEVDPADVVSIPIDYNNAKMRVCRYKVLGVVTTPFEPKELLRKSVIETPVSDPNWFNIDNEDENETCCSSYACACPDDCGCDCMDVECSSCPDNEDNYCQGCGDYLADCECDDEPRKEQDTECDCPICKPPVATPCAGNCCGCPSACVSADGDNVEPYPYEDELEDDPIF